MDEVMVEVLRSNDSKIPPNGKIVRDENGKIGKPSTYRAPDIPDAMCRVDSMKTARRLGFP